MEIIPIVNLVLKPYGEIFHFCCICWTNVVKCGKISEWGVAMIRKLYPGGRDRAFNITYDDGVTQDLRFVELMNRYGLKGTFNLNSELMRQGFAWTHPNGMVVKRLSPDTALWLYRGHEVASHTRTHPYLENLSPEELGEELGRDKADLEEMLGLPVAGFAVPFHYYGQEIADCARELGFEYARMSEFSHSYTPGTDWYYWKTGFYHIEPGLTAFVGGFLDTEEELAVCQIVGHSYDLDTEGLWDTMDAILRRVSGDGRVWSCTNLELVRYLKAMTRAELTEDSVSNPTEIELWFRVGERVLSVPPGETVSV